MHPFVIVREFCDYSTGRLEPHSVEIYQTATSPDARNYDIGHKLFFHGYWAAQGNDLYIP